MKNIIPIILLATLSCRPSYGLIVGAVVDAEVQGNRAVIRPSKAVSVTAKRGEWRVATEDEIARAADTTAAEGETFTKQLTREATEKLNKEDLEAYGRSVGVELDRRETKANMIEHLFETLAARSAGPEGAQGPEGQGGDTGTGSTEGDTGNTNP